MRLGIVAFSCVVGIALASSIAVADSADMAVGRSEIGFDWGGGTMAIDNEMRGVGGFGVRFTKRYAPRFAVRAEADLWLSFGLGPEDEPKEPGGLLPRLAVAARISVARPRGKSFGGDFWIDIGAGISKPLGYGAAPAQTDVELGIGTQIDFLFRSQNSPTRSFGGYLALRTIIPTRGKAQPGVFFSVGYIWTR